VTQPRICILGYGKVARELHRPVWQRLAEQGRSEVALICEPSAAGARVAQADFPRAKVVRGDAHEALAAADCEIVDICTPGHTHASLTLQALSQGLDVMVEKPLAHSLAEVDAIIQAIGTQRVNVCQTLRFAGPSQALVEAIGRGRIGTVTRLQVTHHARHILSEAAWVTQERPDGLLFENAIHVIDLCQHILGAEEPLHIDAAKFFETSHRRVLTGVELLATHPSGAQVTIDFVQDSLLHSSFRSRVAVCGTGADAELDFSPPGFRLLSGLVDPVTDLRAGVHRLVTTARGLVDPARRAQAHQTLAEDLFDARATGRQTTLAPTQVRSTITIVEALSELWRNGTARDGRGPTVSFMAG
jgi:predicted dehydrogenase